MKLTQEEYDFVRDDLIAEFTDGDFIPKPGTRWIKQRAKFLARMEYLRQCRERRAGANVQVTGEI